LQVAFTSVGQWIEMTVHVPTAGEYELNLGYKKNNGRGNPQLSIDGINQGPVVDEYVAVTTEAGMYLANLGKVQLTAGDHTLRFTLAGRTGGSSNTVSLDFLGFTLQSAAPDPTITSITPVDVTTSAGTAPALPSQVTTVYSDGSNQQVEVAWDSISPSQYASAGSFTVYGTVTGTEIRAEAKVTVLAVSKTAAVVNGTHSVIAGDHFELTYGLSGLNEDIYSQDITLTYDPSKVEFVSATSLDSEAYAIYTRQTGADTVRILVASLGENNAAKTDGNVLNVKWKAGLLTESDQTEISFSNVIIANAAGEEANLDSVSHGISVIPVITGTPGDGNGDGKITIADLAIAAKYYGKTSADPDWDPYKFADVNADGKIDIEDLAFLARKILGIE
jgi:hypothetical protein